MTQHTTSQTLQMVNFTVGFALLVMLFPVAGKAVEEPAGVRTAIEMVSKKITLKAIRSDPAPNVSLPRQAMGYLPGRTAPRITQISPTVNVPLTRLRARVVRCIGPMRPHRHARS